MSPDPREFEHPIDGTGGTVPASTSPLVDVIAEVLAAHEGVTGDSLGTEVFCDGCGEGESPASTDDKYQWHAAHQARAVLAAIEQAGTVEWGVRTTYCDVVTVDTKADAQAIAKDSGYPVVSRITGPWTAVE